MSTRVSETPSDTQSVSEEEQLQAFIAVWRTLAPAVPARDYYNDVKSFQDTYRNFVKPTVHGTRFIDADKGADFPDNSAQYERVVYRYNGLEAVNSLLAAKLPIAFVTWHHGAIQHLDYGVVRVLPTTAVFTRQTFQYGRVFSVPMLGAGGFALLRMDRYLREGRPILYYIDGAPIGQTVRLPMIGVPSDLAIAPIRIIRSVEGAQLVPVTHSFRKGNIVEITFHAPSPPPERLASMTERDILAALIPLFENDRREQGPEQVLVQYLPFRARLGQNTGATNPPRPKT
jgi:hypothetical protein